MIFRNFHFTFVHFVCLKRWLIYYFASWLNNEKRLGEIFGHNELEIVVKLLLFLWAKQSLRNEFEGVVMTFHCTVCTIFCLEFEWKVFRAPCRNGDRTAHRSRPSGIYIHIYTFIERVKKMGFEIWFYLHRRYTKRCWEHHIGICTMSNHPPHTKSY